MSAQTLAQEEIEPSGLVSGPTDDPPSLELHEGSVTASQEEVVVAENGLSSDDQNPSSDQKLGKNLPLKKWSEEVHIVFILGFFPNGPSPRTNLNRTNLNRNPNSQILDQKHKKPPA